MRQAPTPWYWAGFAVGLPLPLAAAALAALRLLGLRGWPIDIVATALRHAIPR
jgi:hypothetical protein